MSKREMDVDQVRFASAEPYGRRVQILLAKGHYAAAERCVSQAAIEMESDENNMPLLEVPLGQTGICYRNLNILENNYGALLVGDLLDITTDSLLSRVNSGTKTVDSIWRPVLRYAANRIDGK